MFLAIVAIAQLGNGLWHLAVDTGSAGAIDLLLRHTEVHRWFAGEPVYPVLPDAVYPPATYALLWPLIGWADPTVSRGLWIVLSGAGLWWLATLTSPQSGSQSRLARLAVGLLPLSISAAGLAVGNGQLIQILLPVCVGMVLLVRHGQRLWTTDLVLAGMGIGALTKPTLSIPFLVLAFLSGGSVFWLALLVPAYLGLTLVAAAFQPTPLLELIREWIGLSTVVATSGGYGNLHQWLAEAGLAAWILPLSTLVLIAFSIWVYFYRSSDTWVLLGVTGIVSRLWTYHRSYDDLLILLPVVALVRFAAATEDRRAKWTAAGLVTVMMLLLMAPSRLQGFPFPINSIYMSAQVATWLVALIVLLAVARMDSATRLRAHRRQPTGVDTELATSATGQVPLTSSGFE